MPLRFERLLKDDDTFWPLRAAIGFPLALIVGVAAPIPDFAFALLLFFLFSFGTAVLVVSWAVLGAYAVFVTCLRLWRRKWRRAAVSIVLPLSLLWIGFHLESFGQFCFDAGDTLHFLTMRPAYMRTIRKSTPNGQPALQVIYLNGISWSVVRGLAYDESDEVEKCPDDQSPEWKARAQGSGFGSDVSARPFPGHFSFTRHWYFISKPG